MACSPHKNQGFNRIIILQGSVRRGAQFGGVRVARIILAGGVYLEGLVEWLLPIPVYTVPRMALGMFQYFPFFLVS